jgi:hypothetical protein
MLEHVLITHMSVEVDVAALFVRLIEDDGFQRNSTRSAAQQVL